MPRGALRAGKTVSPAGACQCTSHLARAASRVAEENRHMSESSASAVGSRPEVLRTVDLSRLFAPLRIAVVGASDSENRPNMAVWRRLRAYAEGVGAEIMPVNPTRATVDGLPCAASLLDLSGPIDLVAILVSDVAAVVGDAIKMNARFAVAFASGFAESGTQGEASQARLAQLVQSSELRLLGPNTTLNMFDPMRRDLPGRKIALLTQSGHQGRPIYLGQELGIGVKYWAPTGNEVDLEFADFARWFADDPEIGVIAAYVEGFANGRTFQSAADHAMKRGVPIVCIKVGRTAAGATAAGTHTGKLADRDSVVSAAFRQYGVVRVEDMDELLDVSQLFARCPNQSDGGVVVYSISGGTNAHVTDVLASYGVMTPRLSTDLQERLHEWIPDYLNVSNPVDTGGYPVGDDRGLRILELLVHDPQVGMVVCAMPAPVAGLTTRLAEDLIAVAAHSTKPICVIWGSPVGLEPEYRETLLASSKVVVFRSARNCARAIAQWQRWHQARKGYVSGFDAAPYAVQERTNDVRASLGTTSGPLTEHASKALLSAYGIMVTKEMVVGSRAEAVRAAESLTPGLPVVLKISGAEFGHKTELKGLRLGVIGEDRVARAYDELAEISGGEVLVSEMVTDAVAEAVVGMTHDPLFGPVIMAGIGGVLIEVLNDVAFRIPPFTEVDARLMVKELSGIAVLDGARARPPADVDAIVDTIMKLQHLAADLGDAVAEIDVNPLAVRPRGRGVVALDALVVLK